NSEKIGIVRAKHRFGSTLWALVVAAGSLWVSPLWPETPPRSQKVGRVVGHIDGVRFERDSYYVAGWACQEGMQTSIDIHIYADHSAYDAQKGTFVLAGIAHLESEPAVDQACQSHGGRHRFRIELSNQVLSIFQGR